MSIDRDREPYLRQRHVTNYANDLAHAIHREMRSILAASTRPNLLNPNVSHAGLGLAQARAVLRVEANTAALINIEEDDRRDGRRMMGRAFESNAERTFMGVSLYHVHHTIPAPGWRVINPLKVR